MGNNNLFVSLKDLLQTKLFDIADTQINIITIITFFVVLLVTWMGSKLVRRTLEHYFKRKGVKDEGTIGITSRLVHFIIMAVGIGLAVRTIGIDISALFAAGALFAIGIGFAMQNIAQNFVSGVILMVERAIKPGDILHIEGQMVRVIQMNHRAIIARTLDDEDLIIPNSTFVQTTVKNYTLRDQLYRIRVEVGVVYSADMTLVKQTLETCAQALPERSQQKAPIVFMQAFGSSSVDFEVSVWLDDPWVSRQVRSKLYEAMWWALKEAGVTIAFPQVDVHFDPPVVESLTSLRSVPPATSR
ncbi:MAG: mechanosensitive ion channel domain-containing protein [Candidatus Latescibacterota bacterium]